MGDQLHPYYGANRVPDVSAFDTIELTMETLIFGANI